MLLLKREVYAIRSPGLHSLRTFLAVRLQYVQNDSKRLSSFPVTCGLPQASVPGPQLILIL